VSLLLSIALSSISTLVIFLFVFQLFRFPAVHKLSKVIMSSVIVGIYNNMIYEVFRWTKIEPILSILLMASLVRLIARRKWLTAFMATIVGTVVYTVILGFVILSVNQLFDVSLELMIFEDTYAVQVRVVTLLVLLLLIYLMKYYRIGITTLYHHKLKPRTGTGISVLSITFAVIVITFVTGIALIEMNLSNFIWVVLSFCLSLLILLYSFYRKEMEEE
jgi:hypothetical protein